MTIRCTYYHLVDAKNGVRLQNTDEKINWLEGRIQKIIIRPVDEFFALRDTNEKIRDLNLAVLGILCDGIASLSEFLPKPKVKSDKGVAKQRFKNFVTHYLYPHLKQRHQYANKLWDSFRSSMAHGFLIHRGTIEDDPCIHFQYDSKRALLRIHLKSFFDEFKEGSRRFFEASRNTNDQQLRQALDATFNKFFDELVTGYR